MRYLTHLAQPGKQADTLIILLPGAYQQPEDFIKEGFVSAVDKRDLSVDLIMAELSFSYIADLTALTEIHQNLILPAISKSYQNIWLAGISIGGYVAIAYANHYPAQLAGLLLLAPYPGNRITTGEIALAGGVHAWMPESLTDEDTERSNWSWLKTYARSTDIEVHLGYGADDRFAESHTMMTEILPDSRVDKIAGEHSWPVWQQLWHNFLDKRFAKVSHE
jgi:enterochelin esterase-like enzyme